MARTIPAALIALPLAVLGPAQDISPTERLADALVAARTGEERAAALEAAPELVGPDLRRALVARSRASRTKGDYPGALALAELARRVAEQAGDRAGVGETWNLSGNLHDRLGNADRAMDCHGRALAVCEEEGDRACVARALLGMSEARRARSAYEDALAHARRALAIGQELGDASVTARALNGLGRAYQLQGAYDQALDHYRQALASFTDLGDEESLANAHNGIGRVHTLRGELDPAIEHLERSLALNEKVGHRHGVATGLNNLGIAHSMRGDYGKAAAFFRKGLAEYEELGDKTGIANGLNNIGIVHRLQDDAPMALEFHTRALAVKESLGDKASLAGSLNNLGLTYADLGDQRKALEHYGRALRLAEEIGSAHERANVLTNMAAALDLLGEHDEAVATYDRALRAREELGDRWGAARVMSGIAWLHLRRRDHARAVEYAERAAGVAREAGLRTTLAEALTTLGSARLALEQAGAAREAWEEAIAATEDWRTRLAGGEAQQQRAFEGRTSPYYGMVGLHAAVGRAAESLLYAERAKARVLLDVLRSGRVNVTKDMSDRERAEEQRITLALGSLNAALARESRRPSPDASRMAALKSDLEKARLEHQALQAGVYARLPRLRAERGEAPAFRIEEAGPLLPDTRTALVEYAVAEDASYLFTVTRSTGGDVEARVHRLPVERRALEALVTDLRGRMASRDLAVQDRGRKAFDLLLGPAWAELSGREHLVIVPDGALWEVPFQALVTPHGRFLIEDAAVSYAPSLAFLREVSARRRPSPDAIGAFLGVGNPALGKSPPEGARPGRRDAGFGPLPEAEREVKALAELYGPSASRLRIGSEAREESVKADAGGFRVLHFATHGVVNDASPMYSYLLLAQEGPRAEDGLLEAWELMRLDLAAELVVLSACETGRGRVGRGEGMVGLSWALFVAGSPTVVVSQWKVDSASTAKLMIAFHESLRSGRPGATKASALRSAARRLLRARETRHPFFWAAFGVVGDAS